MRYQAIKGSQSSHCCFEATVVDTSKPYTIGKDPTIYHESVCECFDLKEAKRIARALNSDEELVVTVETV